MPDPVDERYAEMLRELEQSHRQASKWAEEAGQAKDIGRAYAHARWAALADLAICLFTHPRVRAVAEPLMEEVHQS